MRALALGWLRRLTLGRKFIVSFGLILLLLGVSLGAILFYLSRINSYVERHTRITIPAVVTAADMRQTLFQASLTLAALAMPHSSTERGDLLRELEAVESTLRHALEEYRATHAARTHPILYRMLVDHGRNDLADQEDRTLDRIDALLRDLSSSLEGVKGLFETDRKDQAVPHMTETGHTIRRLIETATTLMEVHTNIDGEMKSEGNSLLRQAGVVILALVVMLGLIIAATYAMITMQIAQPLGRLAEMADRITRQDLSADFAPWPATDEVGRLARSLGTMLTTLRERTRALERKTKELESFTYSVAHDLKAPLREVEGFSSLLLKRLDHSNAAGLDEKATHYLQMIRASTLRMAEFIDDLLKYSRLEAQAVPKSSVNIRRLLDAVIAEVIPGSTRPSPRVDVHVPFTDVWGEPTSIRQMLINLVDNAVKFSRDSNAPEITIGGRVTDGQRLLWIQDNGIGFDPKDAEKIFGLFERLHRQDEYEGTGAGLAIVKLVMDKHDGRVWAESSPGKGSTFYVAFPDEEVNKVTE